MIALSSATSATKVGKASYITTPIYYVNDKPHIGHAYTTIAADVVARFRRLDGDDVHFLTGTDEHGQKVAQAAANEGLSPQAFTDKVSATFRQLAEDIGASHTDFIRTTEVRHKRAVTALWQRLAEKGYIYKGTYAGWYAVRDEAFYKEDELVDGKAPSGAPVEWVEEASYFFRLSAFTDKLLAYYAQHPTFVIPKSRYNEVISFVKQGLEDLSISRTTFSWGVSLPVGEAETDPAAAPSGERETHVVYVWLDALTNYISALGYPDATDLYTRFWPEAIHIVGKDILRFHAIYWPAFLMAADLPLPKQIVAHGWWTNEGQKISKSLGNVIDPYDLVDGYGLDALRYFLLREVPFGQDGDFSRRALVGRINNDLANDLGNLAQRVLTFVAKRGGGVVPTPSGYLDQDRRLLHEAYGMLSIVRPLIGQEMAFHRYLEALWRLIGDANRYIDAEQPWSLSKTDTARMATVLYVLMEVLRCVAILLTPVMPGSMANLLHMLGVEGEDARNFHALSSSYALEPGVALPAPRALFPRYEVPPSVEEII